MSLSITYSAAVFASALLLLERSADAFLDQVANLAKQIHVSPILIALLTAGAEWEELAVVISSLSHRAPSLALGNIIGSSISNVLGAFSLGLLFSPAGGITFDESAKRFAAVQFGVTSVVIGLLLLVQRQARKGLFENVVGISLVVLFLLYLVGLFYAIGSGMMQAPEPSDSGSSDGDSSSSSASSIVTESDASTLPTRRRNAQESTPLLLGPATSNSLAHRLRAKKRRATFRALRKLVWALLLLSLSGYLLSRSTLDLAAALGLSDTVLGMTLLAFATTLPEKMLSVLAGAREDASGVLMASTAGSNVFLLTLCLGVALFFHAGPSAAASVRWQELALLEACALALLLVAYTGGRRWHGLLLLAGYVAFLVAEVVYEIN